MDHLMDDEELPRHERELTLSTGAILGIFLALAVLCGGFFGFGYNMGRKSVPAPLTLSDVSPETGVPAVTSTNKPAAGSPLDSSTAVVPTPAPKPARRPTPPPETTASTTTDDVDTAASTPKPAVTRSAATTPATPAPVVRQPVPVTPAALNPSVPAATGFYMVQVAAVSHKEDADLLLGALRARGYAVMTRTAAGDSFIHVQVGPFHDKKEADAMRQRLLTDGYNAIVK